MKNKKQLFFLTGFLLLFLSFPLSSQAQTSTCNSLGGTCVGESFECASPLPAGNASCGEEEGSFCCQTGTGATNDGTCSTLEGACINGELVQCSNMLSSGNQDCIGQYGSSYICCDNSAANTGGETELGETTDSGDCGEGFEKRGMLCWPTSAATGLSDAPILFIIINLLDWLLYIFGFIALIAFVVSGLQYLLSAGNSNMADSAKRHATWSIIGVLVALAGLVILRAIDALLFGSAFI